MPSTSLQKGKGKAVPLEVLEHEPLVGTLANNSSKTNSDSDSDSSSGSDSDSSSDDSLQSSGSDWEDDITEEFLNTLLERARQNAALKARIANPDLAGEQEEEEIRLDSDNPEERPLPSLNPGVLPSPYIQLGESSKAGPSGVRDLDAEKAEEATISRVEPAAPLPPPELSAKGKPLTKLEKKALKNKTAGPSWYDLPAPAEADLPRLYREVEALRLRNQLDPKRFYRKDEGERKGIKGLPKHFAIGTILPSTTPFGTASADNLSRASRKRTLVDELVDDAETKSYAKKKFKELQTVRGARGRGTLAQKKAMRKPKW